MQPRGDKLGVILDQMQELDLIGQGMRIFAEKISPDKLEIANRIFPVQDIWQINQRALESFGAERAASIEIAVLLSTAQVKLAHLALKAVNQMGTYEADRIIAGNMCDELATVYKESWQMNNQKASNN